MANSDGVMMLTENYTFQLGDDGTVLNSDAVAPFVDITRVIGLGSAPYRQIERRHEGQDGGFMNAEFEDGRHIALEGDVYANGSDLEPYLDTLREEFAPSTTLVPFYFKAPGRTERVLYVKPLGVREEWTTTRRIGQAPVRFEAYAEDPRIYTSAGQTVNVDVNFPSAVTGFDFDFDFDFSFGAAIVGNGETISVGGNRSTPPTLTINVTTGPCVNPRIIHQGQSRRLETNITLSTGDSLVFDPYRRTVTLNGTANRRSALIVDEWFFLQPGDNLIGFRSDSNDDSTLTVSYRDAWR